MADNAGMGNPYTMPTEELAAYLRELASFDECHAPQEHDYELAIADRLTELAAEVERLRGFSAQAAHAIGLVDGALDVFDPGWHSAYFDDEDTAIIRAAAEAARNADNKPATEA